MYKLLLLLFVFQFLSGNNALAQKADSTLDALQEIPVKYITGIDKKITQYTNRITSKTEKTLTKLSRWENKIKGEQKNGGTISKSTGGRSELGSRPTGQNYRPELCRSGETVRQGP